MVARMMKWRPWSPSPSQRSFEARILVKRVEGLNFLAQKGKLVAEVAWKGSKGRIGSLRRRGVKMNVTREIEVGNGGFGVFDEEFRGECVLFWRKDGGFHPWIVDFSLFFAGSNHGPKKKIPLIGVASLNLMDLASKYGNEMDLKVPLLLPGSSFECNPPTLHIALSLLELRTVQGSPDTSNGLTSPVNSSPLLDGALSSEKNESSSRAKFRKVMLLKGLVSNEKKNKACLSGEDSEGRCSKNDDSEPPYSCYTDSLDGDIDEDVDDNNDSSNLRRSFNYGSLRSANFIGESLYLDLITDQESYHTRRKSDVSYIAESSYMFEQHVSYIPKRSILPWRKRKLGFRSPKNKGEPLLKKTNGEEGGDDIDFDRRQLSSFDESRFGGADVSSHFGDDHFSVGSWESKELVSRDGYMKLCTQVFFASIDQRSERAAGESACAVLVAIIAEWFQVNQGMMPTRSEFDNLIREGSLEWRKLCENQIYQERFPDKHFDLETVLEAKIRPLSVVPDNSFVGFFSPESLDDYNSFDFLNGVMSFDNIWDEISHTDPENTKDILQLYIVSWNDHFFIVMVERDAYYIVDTLGERLHEGCNQAYILKFDDSTLIQRVSSDNKLAANIVESTDCKHVERSSAKDENLASEQGDGSTSVGEELVCSGKDSCKEYIKSFLAAIPIRGLQVDLKKGLTSMSIHRRLQIEFHSTKLLKEILTQSAALISATVESDSEFSLPTESDTYFSSSPEPTENFSWPVKSCGELQWPAEPTASSIC